MLDAIPQNHPPVINLSRGGACLCFSQPPDNDRSLSLKFRYSEHAIVVPCRIAWIRLSTANSDREEPTLAEVWLVGFAFTEGGIGTRVAHYLTDYLHSGDIKVDLLVERSPVDNWPEDRARTPGLITFDEKSILHVKTAARELLPVFAKHFTDVHMVFMRDRLELSAPFRSPTELNPSEPPRQGYPAIRANQMVEPLAPVTIEQPVALAQPKSERAMHARSRVVIGVASLAAVIFGASFLGVFLNPIDARPVINLPVAGQSIPEWAAGIDQTSLDGWIGIQKEFNLPNVTVRSAIQILRTNDKYGPGQTLYDLTRYPAQVKRAFRLLAGVKKRGSFNFGTLHKDLAGRIVEGVRFPDEAPGGNYSLLQRESFNNVVVITTVELLQRYQNDPGAKNILAAL